jgi:hypothetical protein
MLLGRPLFPGQDIELTSPTLIGKTDINQLDLIIKVTGLPSDDTWPGVSQLPLYSLLEGPALSLSLSASPPTVRVAYEKKIAEPSLSLLDRLLVPDPQKRLSAKAALVTRSFFYFIFCEFTFIAISRIVPILSLFPLLVQTIFFSFCLTLADLDLTPGQSFHEFQTKSRRREEKEIEDMQREREENSKESGSDRGLVMVDQPLVHKEKDMESDDKRGNRSDRERESDRKRGEQGTDKRGRGKVVYSPERDPRRGREREREIERDRSRERKRPRDRERER